MTKIRNPLFRNLLLRRATVPSMRIYNPPRTSNNRTTPLLLFLTTSTPVRTSLPGALDMALGGVFMTATDLPEISPWWIAWSSSPWGEQEAVPPLVLPFIATVAAVAPSEMFSQRCPVPQRPLPIVWIAKRLCSRPTAR
jgi:hypothetical protein